MTGRHRLKQAVSGLDTQKKDKEKYIPGVLGIPLGGSLIVEVPDRRGYVYVRLRDDQDELVQAYNSVVSPVYDLPVLVMRDDIDPSRYRVVERDLGRYNTWPSSYVPKHGNQHSFSAEVGAGGDPVWVYGRQMMPLLPHPSGTSGADSIVIERYTYYWQAQWICAGGTGTAAFTPFKPADNTARMVLVYLDAYTNPTLLAGDTYFPASLTGTCEVLPYVPALPEAAGIPVAAIRLVSGTSIINWDNIYDLRPWIVGDGFIPTGSYSSYLIQDEGVTRPVRQYLNFIGPTVWALDNAGTNATDVIISGSASAGHTIQDEGGDLNARTNLNFIGAGVVATDNPGNDATDVTISGTSTFATLVEAQAGVIESEMIAPSTLPVWVINDAFIRRDGYGGNQRGQYAVDLQRLRSLDSHVAAGDNSVISGGEDNSVSGSHSGIGSGEDNLVGLDWSFIGGGDTNLIATYDSVIAGGYNNQIIGAADYSFIGAGDGNVVNAINGIIVGGTNNRIAAGGDEGFIGGGFSHYISGSYGTIPGGYDNTVSLDYGFAQGRRARSIHQGATVFTDSQNYDFQSGATDEFAVRAVGGVRFVTQIDGAGVPIVTGTFQISNGLAQYGGEIQGRKGIFTNLGIRTQVSTADVASPPTDLQLDTAFGLPATVGDGFIGLVDDAGAGNAVWLIVALNSKWWYASLTEAT
jgi:hypothetical protein